MRLYRFVVGVASVWLASACAPAAQPTSAPAPAVDTVVVVDTLEVVTESEANRELEERAARLQIQLLEKDVQLEGLQSQLDAARQEVVRNMAKLQSQASRAEAASGMAEAEIALETLGRAPGGEQLPEYAQTQDLLTQSAREFETENYGGALYLATQARTVARSGQGRVGGGGGESLRAGESLFALPVPLETSGRSNVRSGPGLSFDVQFTLDEGTPVVGQSYTSQWLRVMDEQGRSGWIYHTLVTSRSR